MTVYTVIMVACLAINLDDCRTYHWPVEASAIPTAAFQDAQQSVAGWSAGHPKWRVIKWRMVAGQPA